MSRYFERADHAARVLDANYNLMLNPSKGSSEQRWQLITASLGFDPKDRVSDPQTDIARLLSDPREQASIVSCIKLSRENASQIREQISSETWERVNQLYHEISRSQLPVDSDVHPLRMINNVREGMFTLYGVTDATMSHDEGWYFIQLGRYMERACGISRLMDAYYSASLVTDDLDWVALLNSCLAFEAYCKVYTADLTPERVAEFLLLNAPFPYTVRHAADCMWQALEGIADASRTRKSTRIDRMIGQLRSSLAYAQVEDIMEGDLHDYLLSVVDHCRDLHFAIHEFYLDYPIAAAFEA